MKTKSKTAVALTILLMSLLGVMPTATFANLQGASGSVSINATGNATPIGKGHGNNNATSVNAALNLAGAAFSDGGGNQVRFLNLTGSLLIGSINYPILKGQGEENSKGTIELEAKTTNASHTLELQLHGSVQGNNVVFSSKQSKLSSQYFLSLSGQQSLSLTTITITSSTNSECSSQGHDENQNNHWNECSTHTFTFNTNSTCISKSGVESPENEGHHECSTASVVTVTQTVTHASNNTITVTETVNQTVTQTIAGVPTATVTVTQTNNETTTEVQTTTSASATTVTVIETTVSTATITANTT